MKNLHVAFQLEDTFTAALRKCVNTKTFTGLALYSGWGDCVPLKHGNFEQVDNSDEGITVYAQSFTPDDEGDLGQSTLTVMLDTCTGTGCDVHKCRERELMAILCSKFGTVDAAYNRLRWGFSRANTDVGFRTVFTANVSLDDPCAEC